MERLKSPKSVDPVMERSSVVLFEPNAPMRKKLANFYRAHGLLVYEVSHLNQLQDMNPKAPAPSLLVVKLDHNRESIEAQMQRLQLKFKTKIPLVILASHIDATDLLPLVQIGARSVLLKLESEPNWQNKLTSTLNFARPREL